MKIDAHCHTDCSDGNLTIEERIAMVRAVGLDAATITDHDFISSEQVRRAQAAAGSMPFIPGIELSLAHHEAVVHLLGYYIEPEYPPLQGHILKVQEIDKKCTQQVLNAMEDDGISYELEDFRSGSLHTFYSLQMVKRIARDRFNNDRKRMLPFFMQKMEQAGLAYVDFSPWSVFDAIQLIHDAGGFCVLAHPGGSEDTAMEQLGFLLHDRATIRQYVEWGLDGIEVSSPVHTRDEKQFFSDLAREYSLLQTAGSDCHGNDPFLGPALMGLFTDIPADLYDRMLKLHEEMQ